MSKKSKGSLLRLLSPLRAGPSKSAVDKRQPTLKLHVADYGSLLIQTTDDAPADGRPTASRSSSHASGSGSGSGLNGNGNNNGNGNVSSTDDNAHTAPPPSNLQELQLSGTLEIMMPPHLGRRRVRAIRVGLSARTKLDMGKGRGWEEDEIFARRIDLQGQGHGATEGVVLEPGLQVYAFTLFLPDTIPVHDWHPNAVCGLTLYGEIEGDPSGSGSASRSHSRSATPGGSSRTTPMASRSGSPSRGSRSRSKNVSRQGSYVAPDGQGLNSIMAQLEDMSVRGEGANVIPHAPPYADGPTQGQAQAPWWNGTARVTRPFEVLYNPNPAGGVTELSLRLMGEQQGLGGYRLDLTSEIWTVCAPLAAKLTIPVPPLSTTIYSLRVLLSQTIELFSPRDTPSTPPSKTTRIFSVLEAGSIPPRGARGDGLPSLWRGTEAGGKDVDELVLEATGWLPSDDSCRPTSVPQMRSPIRVSHQLISEVFFSVAGEDDVGRPVPKGAPPGVRIFRLTKGIVVPSCAMIPMWLQPPEYEALPTEHPPGPCPHRPLADDWEQDAREYKPDLDCVLCRTGVPPTTRPGWRDCACGHKGAQLEERGRRLNEAAVTPGKWTFDTAARGPQEGGEGGTGVQEVEEEGEEEDEEERRGRRGVRER